MCCCIPPSGVNETAGQLLDYQLSIIRIMSQSQENAILEDACLSWTGFSSDIVWSNQ